MGYVAAGYVAAGYVAANDVQRKPIIVWDNRFADAAPVADSTALGAAANIADFRAYTFWRPSSLPSGVTVDCGSAKSANSITIINHNLFSTSCRVRVYGSTDNFASSKVLRCGFVPDSDLPLIKFFNAASYQYWRIEVDGVAVPTLSVVALGTRLEMPTGVPYGVDPLARKMIAQTNISERGLPLGKNVIFEEFSQSLYFRNVLNTWLRATWLPAWKAHLRDQPFLLAIDAGNYANEVYLVEATDMKTPSAFALRSNLQLDVKGVALP